jgi:hypothetical protein
MFDTSAVGHYSGTHLLLPVFACLYASYMARLRKLRTATTCEQEPHILVAKRERIKEQAWLLECLGHKRAWQQGRRVKGGGGIWKGGVYARMGVTS